ncbi:MAG: triose-phosphate isomerase [bacterium]|nr:triose-phosphate isomerase [bacterium]
MKKLIAGNWKMSGSIDETLKRITEFRFKLKELTNVDVLIAPPFTALYSAHVAIQETPFFLGAQDAFWETEGAYTGEISPAFLRDVGCQYVIIAHSERRRYFGETNETANKKIRTSLTQELIPVYCIGETEEERDLGKTNEVLERQIKEGLEEISMFDLKQFVIAYEPVWAIGTGKNATTGQVAEAHAFIRNSIAKRYDAPTANNIRILYGGSAKPTNAKELLETRNVDGLLVGGASLVVDQFVKICQTAQEIAKES